ncbi:uncharacterized protein MELLADRAFT_70907 [Melampsora larici-populina 98AG31]|uniref:Uncharacterized protein n=1 Tax=Melampsora larici-populina (strain 98AG31 / pathotype 3-4-7) TaxID=747676 RepID=F4R9E3_MELLP|nr:uncharacterized protein MELLADRAFT_70907 [Melampsora larici-populina 98AG31]EGG10970.1 hypothetical protein MELLADRAFT_70907 [Melampsora larici-populina 98AG31]
MMTQTCIDQPESKSQMLSTQPGAISPMSLSLPVAPDGKQKDEEPPSKDGPVSRIVLRLRGGEGHHACAECCCFMCICCGLEELCCIGTLDECFGMCC